MIAWVYEAASRAMVLDRLLVATDADQILQYCRDHQIPTLLTSHSHPSGTDRLIEVAERESASGQPADLYVNIQGDEPMVTAAHIELLVKPFIDRGNRGRPPSPEVWTLKVAITREAAADPHAVKVVTDPRGLALYFSRAPIPCECEDAGRARYYKHLGLYAYTPEALQRFRDLPPSPLEQIERLEQLRFLENGISITVIETTEDTIGVDTEEDLQRVEEYFRRMGRAAG